MTENDRYQETVEGIALARRTVEQTAATIRQAMDNGDDPVIFLHNLSVALGKESPFQSGGQGAAIYTVACFLLAESGFFEPPDLREKCICTGPPDGEFVATCPIHRGSWAETLAILADRELTAELTRGLGEREDEDDPIDAEDLRGAMEARNAVEDVAIAEEMLPAGVEALGHAEFPEPTEMERRYGLRVGQCTDPDCFQAGCDGDHEPLRCPTTGVKRGNIATVNSYWVCCGGLYPDHQESLLIEPDRHFDGGA